MRVTHVSLRCGLLPAAAMIWAIPAVAQNTTIVPGAEQFSLPPGTPQTTPSPTPTPVPSATVAPPPVIVPRPTPTVPPTPRATPAPRVTPTTSASPTPSATPASSVTPAVPPTTAPGTGEAPVPAPIASPTPDVSFPDSPPPAPATSLALSWLWWLLGLAVVTALAVLVLRRSSSQASVADEVVEPVAPAPVSASSSSQVPSPAATPTRPPAAAAAAIALDLRPQRVWTRGPDAHLAFELLVSNSGAATLSGVRPVVTLVSAGPHTAADVAEFSSALSSLPGGEPFDLRAGETRVVSGELTLPGSAMHVTTVAEREMIVPVAMAGVTWRTGLSIASTTDAFVVGTGDATTAKLGPIWVDRAGQTYPRLDARRFTPRG